MPIQIQPLTAANLGDARRVNSQYEVTQRLVLSLEDGRLRYRVEPVSPTYFKDYHADPAHPEEYVDTPERAWLLAYAGGQVVGEIRLERWWNEFAYIHLIAVEPEMRQAGVGTALLDAAKNWARDHQHVGLMLETQDDNVPACRLYERSGFELGGFDRYVYRALRPGTREIALYWYCWVG